MSHSMEIEEFIEIVAEFQSGLTPFKARVLNPDPHGEEGRKSMGLTHLGHKLSILATLKECAETAWRHIWESETKAMNVFHRINFETLLDHESNTLKFCKHMMLIELKRFDVINNIYVRKAKQLDDEFCSMFKAMGYSDPTDLSLYFENSTQTEHNMIHQTISSSHIDLEHDNWGDRDTCHQAFEDVSTIAQNGGNEIFNDTCACPIMETEPVNLGTDVLEDESQVISNPSPEPSDMFPDYLDKKSGHLLNLTQNFKRKTAKISHSQKPQFPKIKKKGRLVKSKLKSKKGRRLNKNCSKSHKTMIMKRVHKKPKVDSKYKQVLEILKLGYALISHFRSLSCMLPLPFRFLLNKPRVKFKV